MGREKPVENDYRDFISALNKYSVDYLIIGAYSVIFHTNIPRETKDFDVWIRPSEENADKCVKAIKEFCGLKIEKSDLLGKKRYFLSA